MENRIQYPPRAFQISGDAFQIIFSKSQAEHETHMRQILQRLLENKLFVKGVEM